jgi:diadenylate cyclase
VDKILNYLTQIRWQEYLDMTVVAVLFYLLVVRIKGTRALQIMMGIVLLFVLNFLTRWGGLYVTSWVFQYLWAAILVAFIILFQPEIRRILEEVSPLKILTGMRKWAGLDTISEVVVTAFEMTSKKIGAIIVFCQRDNLDEFILGGTPLDAIVSKPLIESIFFPPSPLHDGAAIIRGNRVVKAGCFLPLPDSVNVPHYFGSRHRAAIGLTERTDAVCLIVSEERGEVSFCHKGRVKSYRNPQTMEEKLVRILQTQKRGKRPSGGNASLVKICG